MRCWPVATPPRPSSSGGRWPRPSASTASGVENAEVPGLHPTRAARAHRRRRRASAQVGEIDPAVLEAHGIGERVAYLEVDLDTLLALPHGERAYRPFSLYPSSDIDLAFEVDDAVPASAVEDAIRACGRRAPLDRRPVRRVPRPRAWRTAAAASPTACASRPRDRTLTDADVAEARTADHRRRAVEPPGATLRG